MKQDNLSRGKKTIISTNWCVEATPSHSTIESTSCAGALDFLSFLRAKNISDISYNHKFELNDIKYEKIMLNPHTLLDFGQVSTLKHGYIIILGASLSPEISHRNHKDKKKKF